MSKEEAVFTVGVNDSPLAGSQNPGVDEYCNFTVLPFKLVLPKFIIFTLIVFGSVLKTNGCISINAMSLAFRINSSAPISEFKGFLNRRS